MSRNSAVVIGLSAVIVAVKDTQPVAYIVRGAGHGLAGEIDIPADETGRDALPFGLFDPVAHETLELGLRSWVAEQTPIRPGYVEQLYTFGNRGRYAGQKETGPRVISVGYLALTQGQGIGATDTGFWENWYSYFPWEDWRRGRPEKIFSVIENGLNIWIKSAKTPVEKTRRKNRVQLCFGLDDGAGWDEERVLERYELLYEARLVPEAVRDKKIAPTEQNTPVPGNPMLFDHRRILATAMGRLRGKLKYRPVIFELMPEKFTLLHLQRTVEAIAGVPLHKQNFRRLVETAGLVEDTGEMAQQQAGRPAALYRFRPDVLLERQAPGVKLTASSAA